jgi:hypothetical protein
MNRHFIKGVVYCRKIFFMKKLPIIVFLFINCSYVSAQVVKVPFTKDEWNMQYGEITPETYLDKEDILLKSGAIMTKHVNLLDGSFEVDMSFPEQRGFPGFAFRMQNEKSFENFYVRPHHSGNPDATQYTPVFNGQAGWQLYNGEGYTKEFTYKFNSWHHIKIDLHGLQAEIFIDDMQKPLIKVAELKNDWKGGQIGLISGGMPVHFANLQYTSTHGASPTRAAVPSNGTGGLVTRYQVSNVVNRALFEKKTQLEQALKDKFTWTTQSTEPSGLLDLARFSEVNKDSNAIAVKVLIESTAEQVKEISFGFSDYVTVYFNNRAVYSGSDKYMSRDYRFLGTIGFFDKLFLPLKKGMNELWFVVSEDFGGWGLQAKFENMDNISLK